MKINELRVGNNILVSLPGEQIRLPHIETTIQGITLFQEIICFKSLTNDGFEIPIKHCSGIELSEEILVKLGLKKLPPSEYTLNTYGLAGFNLWIKDGKFLFNDSIQIDFVHQLQNLYFDLSNEELKYSSEMVCQKFINDCKEQNLKEKMNFHNSRIN